jgi:hypothetical protein
MAGWLAGWLASHPGSTKKYTYTISKYTLTRNELARHNKKQTKRQQRENIATTSCQHKRWKER